MPSDRRGEWAHEAAQRTAAAGRAATPEDEILRALLTGEPAELGLRECWRALG